jgi:hypothetical protein
MKAPRMALPQFPAPHMTRPRSTPKLTAEHWVAKLSPIPHGDIVSIMKGAGFGNRPKKRGLPASIPRTHLSSTAGWVNRDESLRAAEKAYLDGYSQALLFALCEHICFSNDRPLPAWIGQALVQAIGRRRDGVARSLDESLGLMKPPKTKVPPYFEAMIVIEINQAHAAGVAKDDALFEAIATRWGAKKSTIKALYYAVMRPTK